jgi:mitochondrial fission protein ELM1
VLYLKQEHEGSRANDTIIARDGLPVPNHRAQPDRNGTCPRPSGSIATVVWTTAIFAAVVLCISMVIGARLTLPGSGKIPGLETNYWIPPVAAIVGYLFLQSATRYVGAHRRSWREISRHALDDYLLLFLFLLVVCIHFNLKMWIPLINPGLYDQDYFAIDQAARPVLGFLGELRSAIAQVLPAVDIWYQAAFFSVFVLSFLSHALGDRRFHYHNMMALLLIETVGPLTYLIAPALGPFIFEHGPSAAATSAQLHMRDEYMKALQGGASWINAHGSEYFAQPLAAMPSLHVGAAFIILYYSARARSWMMPLAMLAFGWIFIESVVARWHYLIDLPAGLLLAAAVIAVTNRLCERSIGARRREARKSGLDSPVGAAAPISVRGAAAIAAANPQPRVWILKCHRAGDHAQSLALAQALGWPFEVKETTFLWYELLFALAGAATLAGLSRRRSSTLAPPWPDLVILAGRQNETPAKWIRKQSGGRTRIVVIGRYWTPPDDLDFVVTTPQFRLPPHPRVLHNSFPLHRVTKERLETAAASCAARLPRLKRPYLALMVGGSSGPYVFSRETAHRLGREASSLARTLGASLLVSTSARTGRAATIALKRAIDVPNHFYEWQPDDPDNPYLGFLALADRIIVTGDSMSMLAEACSAQKPVHIFEFGGGPAAMRGPRSADRRVRQWWRWSALKDQGVLGLPYAWAIGLPAWRLNRSRDIRLVQERFIASARANWLGDGCDHKVRPAPLHDLDRAAEEVRALLGITAVAAARPPQGAHAGLQEPAARNPAALAVARIRRPA